ncbi:HPr family phosphocarrier protein [Klebsiella quasipneumoniae]|uniref:HPr family phosphocarrier protein n=1 Tax=Klebsiella quasipneumoniae TaxID=1463165 RepID=UPI000CEC65D1|nr:HPr family phosphocarrier protein [Klebsiella quasipneumoniae]ROC60480.1 HPr family phosphocarrier protein [Klebsiella quasipneumoniae subsp. quasipneumoniae]
MLKETVVVNNTTGIHARPAGILAKSVKALDCTVVLNYNGRTIKATSVMNLLNAGIKARSEVEVVCEGTDEEVAMQTVRTLFSTGFGCE